MQAQEMRKKKSREKNSPLTTAEIRKRRIKKARRRLRMW